MADPIEYAGRVPSRTLDLHLGGIDYRAALFDTPGRDPEWMITAPLGPDEEHAHVVSFAADQLGHVGRDLDRAREEALGRARPLLQAAYEALRNRALADELQQNLT